MLSLRTPLITDTMLPYWRQSDPVGEVTNDDSKFGLKLDVSHFKPESLHMDLKGRELIINGDEEINNENGYSRRSFSRTILLPDDVDLTSISSEINENGKLCIEAPKSVTQKSDSS